MLNCINIQRMLWLGHVVRMENNVLTKRVLDTGISRRWLQRRRYQIWKDQMMEIISLFGLSN